MIYIKYKNGITTQHKNIKDASFQVRNICDIHNTFIDEIHGATEQEKSELRCACVLLGINTIRKKDKPIQLEFPLDWC